MTRSPARRRARRRSALFSCVVAAQAMAAAAQSTVQQVEVIGTSPLPGQGVDRNALPYTTQVLRRSAIDGAQADNTTDLLARRLPGVQVNDIQGSPFQADLTFRGFRASGLVGASQGLSVYLDGVRVNEPFGDIVNWDMLPEFAVESVTLVPGANPAFGLNTLGGALSFSTADGRSARGLRGEISTGSFGRRNASVAWGGAGETWSHYLGMGLFDEHGWRDHSAGHLGSLFGKIGLRSDLGELSLSLLAARSRLVGNGLVPMAAFDEVDGTRTPDFGATMRSAVYTHPDITQNRLTQLTARWRRTLDAGSTIEALAYGRNSRRDALNGDAGSDDIAVQASLNRTATRQRGSGGAVAWSSSSVVHQWQAGISIDDARVSYLQTAQAARLDSTRGVQALDEPIDFDASVEGRNSSLSAFITDTWKLAQGTHVTATLRGNRSRVANTLTSVDDASGLVRAQPPEAFVYRSLNPALGVAYRGDMGFTLFANAARNTRVPTAIELGCADPQQPCRLPAGLQSDPYLEQVKSTALEAGVRFGTLQGNGGSVTVFRTDNRNDILFSSVSVTGQQGNFRNFDRTRNLGLDAQWHGMLGPVTTAVTYSHLRATYGSLAVLRIGERNVEVAPGTPIAGLPRHLLKLSLDWTPAPGWSVGGDLQASSRRGIAGNEDGRIADAGVQPVDFSLPGITTVNLRASWRPAGPKGIEWFVRATNILDRESASYGAIAQSVFDAAGNYTGTSHAAVFVAPAAPRAVSAGLRITF